MQEKTETEKTARYARELKLLRQQVADMERFDRVTKLYNHRTYQERLKEELARSARYGQGFSLVLLEVDHFAEYVNRFGQKAGEEVLVMVGYAVRDCIRNVDIGCYYGEAKFVIILPHTGFGGARIVAERMREKMERVLLFKGVSGQGSLASSIGVATFPLNAVTEQELFEQALKALTSAQRQGGNKFCMASELSGEMPEKDDMSVQVAPNIVCSSIDMAYAMIMAVDAKDRFTSIHSQNVALYSVGMARIMGLSTRKIDQLRIAAILHDIGKIGIPDNVIMKPGPLNEDEWRIMRTHPEIGAGIIGQIPDLAECAHAIKHHHERYDGLGYPGKLKGDQIPLDARIISIAETYDNVTSPRPYRKSLSPREALEEIKRNSNTQFDPVPAMAFIRFMASHLRT
jgi:diguanylate cyclase (GGDEF)-like protein